MAAAAADAPPLPPLRIIPGDAAALRAAAAARFAAAPSALYFDVTRSTIVLDAALPRAVDAADAYAHGAHWVAQTARDHVAPEFHASFLHRNPVHRDLLAAAARSRLA